MKRASIILQTSALLLTFIVTKQINAMQDTKEVWKAVPGYHGKVEASSEGRIRTFYTKLEGKILKPQKGLRGKYHRVQIQTQYNYQSVHRLVALAFHPNPDRHPIIRHLDDNGLNNRASNLKWDTQSNNIKFGKKGKNKPYTPLMRQVIKEAFASGKSKLSIAKYFKITDTAVRRVVLS